MIAGFVANLGREVATGGTARGTGLAGYAYDLTIGGRAPVDVFGPQIGAIERALGPATGLDRIANDNRFNGVDRATSQVVTDALSLSGAQRAIAFQGGVAAGLSGLRAGLGADFIAGPVTTGQSVMARLPGFADGGEVTIGGSGGPDSQLFAARVTPGERVRFTPPGSQRDEPLAPLLRQQTRALQAILGTLQGSGTITIDVLRAVERRLSALEAKAQLASAK
jgi:hypothetical protein